MTQPSAKKKVLHTESKLNFDLENGTHCVKPKFLSKNREISKKKKKNQYKCQKSIKTILQFFFRKFNQLKMKLSFDFGAKIQIYFDVYFCHNLIS